MARDMASRSECQLARSLCQAFGFGAAYCSKSFDGCDMLSLESRIRSLVTDLVDCDILSCKRRKSDRSPDDLPSSF